MSEELRAVSLPVGYLKAGDKLMRDKKNEELRFAAERLFEWAMKYSATDGSKELRAVVGDAYHVSQAYLADHTADDGEPVTEEWLLSVGSVRNPFAFFPLTHDDELLTVSKGQHAANHFANVPWKTMTRGHVRRLCEALGVPLMDGKP